MSAPAFKRVVVTGVGAISPLGNDREFRKKIQNMVSDDASRKKLFEELGLPEAKE